MSRYTTDFSGDTIGQDPSGFTDIDSVWAVQDDSGNVLKNSGDGTIQWDTPSSVTNCILRFRMKYISGANNRWQVRLRQVDTNNKIYIGCVYTNDVIDIYERITSTHFRRAYAAFVYGTGWHDVEIVLQDGSLVVRIDTTEIHYDSLNFSSGAVINFNANSGAVVEFDDLDLIQMDYDKTVAPDDNFNDNSIGDQWTISYGSVTNTSFEEIGSELKYSGTPGASGYVYIRTDYTTVRSGWYQEIKFKIPTGAFGVGTEILFRMDADANNFIEISCQADGYRVEKVEDGSQPSGSISDPIALFGNESTTFHTLKLLWDEVLDRVYGWIDNTYIARLSATTTTFPDQQRFILHLNNTNGAAIDRRFENFVARGMDADASPSQSPSQSPSLSPSASVSPSGSPSGSPSLSPSVSPSGSPSESPSLSPSPSPSISPSESPSLSPSASVSPSLSPSASPSISPSGSPSRSPSMSPSGSPSKSPSPSPSRSPSISPSASPSRSPSESASRSPSRSPSESPSRSASVSPSVSPSEQDVTDFEFGDWVHDIREAHGVSYSSEIYYRS